MIVTNRYYLRNVSMDYNSTQTLISKNLTNAVGLDYDWRDQKIYWTDVSSDKTAISRMDFNGSNIEVHVVLFFI